MLILSLAKKEYTMEHVKDILFKDLFDAYKDREGIRETISELQGKKHKVEQHITKELLTHNMHFCLSVNWDHLRRFLYSR